jgi:hypothetical protein
LLVALVFLAVVHDDGDAEAAQISLGRYTSSAVGYRLVDKTTTATGMADCTGMRV